MPADGTSNDTCPTGPVQVPYWPSPGALLAQSRCPTGPVQVPYWPSPGALLAQSRCPTGPVARVCLPTRADMAANLH
jgi:hypothetical protein